MSKVHEGKTMGIKATECYASQLRGGAKIWSKAHQLAPINYYSPSILVVHYVTTQPLTMKLAV